MRVIKFRVYIPFKDIIIYPKECIYSAKVEEDDLLLRLDGTVCWCPMAGIIDTISNKFVLMQFTGLHDKNGIEIWEDDIVRIRHPECKKGDDFYDTNGRVFMTSDGCWAHGNQHGRPPKTMWEYCEVIGNVHERWYLLNNKEEK